MRLFTLNKKELARGIAIPIIADPVGEPVVSYGDELTGIYFQTQDKQFGRITFENLDSLKVCRGEVLPFPDNWKEGQTICWVFKVENSTWQSERYNYEKKVYGQSYEFGGNVDEMRTDFSHYVFRFHDQFIEAIARGFWFEEDEKNLVGQKLQKGHPFLSLSEKNAEKYTAHSLTCQIRKNPQTYEMLVSNAQFCSQKLIEFAIELEGKATVNNSLVLCYRNGKLISSLRGYFGKQIAEFEGVANFRDVEPYIDGYMREVSERRKGMGK